MSEKNPPAAREQPVDPEPTAASFGELGAASADGGSSASLDTLFDISIPVAVEFGRTRMTVQEVLELSTGSVVQLERMVGEPIDVYVSDVRFAEGEVVVIGEHFGVRITRILSTSLPNANAS